MKLKSRKRKGVEETISEESDAFRASEPSPVVAPLPKKETASPANPLVPLELPISGERVTFTVYCLGILNATIMPIISPIPATLYIFLRITIILHKISTKSISSFEEVSKSVDWFLLTCCSDIILFLYQISNRSNHHSQRTEGSSIT